MEWGSSGRMQVPNSGSVRAWAAQNAGRRSRYTIGLARTFRRGAHHTFPTWHWSSRSPFLILKDLMLPLCYVPTSVLLWFKATPFSPGGSSQVPCHCRVWSSSPTTTLSLSKHSFLPWTGQALPGSALCPSVGAVRGGCRNCSGISVI